jgi:hypothetical protein
VCQACISDSFASPGGLLRVDLHAYGATPVGRGGCDEESTVAAAVVDEYVACAGT